MVRAQVKLGVLGILCCAAWSSGVARAVDTVTEPEKCLFRGAPGTLAYLEEENLTLMANGGGVYAFDAASGVQRWHRYLVSRRGYSGAQFGKKKVLCWSEQGVFLLDAVTGKEAWWRRDNQCGGLMTVHLSPDESCVLVVCTEGVVLYGVADGTQRTLPALRDFQAWLPDGQTLLFSSLSFDGEKSSRKWQTMDIDTGRVAFCREEPSTWWDPAPVCSSLGLLAEGPDEDSGESAVKLRDARTGRIVRELDKVGAPGMLLSWLKDGKRLFCVSADRRQGSVIDAETGAVQFVLSREGQRVPAGAPFEDRNGAARVLSRDSANHRYAWKMAPDGEPRRILDGTRFASSRILSNSPIPGMLAVADEEENNLCVHTVYRMENMEKVGEWHVRMPKEHLSGLLIDKGLNHVAASCRVTRDYGNHPRDQVFALLTQERETPVCTGRGHAQAISPDGKYLIVQANDKEACLYDTEKGSILCLYTVEDKQDYPHYMPAAFSDDGKRVAVNNTQTVEVTDLSGDYPRRTMALPPGTDKRVWFSGLVFSPDGRRLLCAGANCARLFDADTGALLHSFEETERFAYPYPEGNGFLGSLLMFAKDWAGMVTDRFKYDNRLEIAFADGGSRVITHTAGQVIRVWDAQSGKLLRTVRTGLPEKRNAEGRINNRIALSENGHYAFAANWDNFAPAALWSLDNDTPFRRYQLPETGLGSGIPTDDGRAVLVETNLNLYRWAGAPQELLDKLPAAHQ